MNGALKKFIREKMLGTINEYAMNNQSDDQDNDYSSQVDSRMGLTKN